MRFFKLFKSILKSEHQHFLFVDYKTYKRYKLIIKMATRLNPNYKKCEIFRRKYKKHDYIVVYGMRYYGKNVKRRTNGYAKDYVYKNPNCKCIYCDTKLNYKNATVDHIVAISKGGNNSKVNLLVCCKDCNSDRGNSDVYEYLKGKNKHRKFI